MHNRICLCLTAAVLLAAGARCPAQAGEGSRPASSNVRGAEYPRIHADGRITFQFQAPTARSVQVQPGPAGGVDSGLGKGPFDMVRGQDGVWSVTVPAGIPGFHYYWLLVDGVAVNDPSSETYFGYHKQTSGVEVPEPPRRTCNGSSLSMKH